MRFLLVGTNGNLDQALYLGNAQLTGLQAGYSQEISQTLTFPSSIPTGVTLNPTGRIAVQIDPEHTVDLVSRTDNAAVSSVVSLNLVPSATATATTTTVGTTTASTTPSVTPVTTVASASTPLTFGDVGSKTKKALKTAERKLKSDLKLFPHKADQIYHDLLKDL